MGLKETISDDLKKAMKASDRPRTEALRRIRASLLEKEIERRGAGKQMTPEDEVSVLTSSVRERKESIEQFKAGGRQDLVAEEEKGLSVIMEYLPKQLTPGEIEQAVREVIARVGAAGPGDFGKVMPQVMKEMKGKAEGKVIQETVKRLLGTNA